MDAWGTVGCENTTNDRLATITDSVSSSAISASGYYDWDVTVDVKAFFDGADNYGWLLRTSTDVFFGTSDWASSDHATLLWRPYLEIIF